MRTAILLGCLVIEAAIRTLGTKPVDSTITYIAFVMFCLFLGADIVDFAKSHSKRK